MKKKTESRKTISNRCDKNWALAVKIAAGYTCQCCGRRKDQLPGEKTLFSHHIIRRAVKILKWSLPNGICVCYNCHSNKAHSLHFIGQEEWHNFIKIKHSMVMSIKYGWVWHNLMTEVEKHPSPIKDLPINEMREIDEALKLYPDHKSSLLLKQNLGSIDLKENQQTPEW